MNTHTLLNRLKQRSHFIQGQKVVLDTDAAAAYGVSIGYLRRAVKRNIPRFPEDVLIQINKNEYAFTETGLVTLSTVLNSPQAIQTNIEIIRELFGFQSN
jgi:hypothetical protein